MHLYPMSIAERTSRRNASKCKHSASGLRRGTKNKTRRPS